jgi:Na+/proline symporter
MFPPPIPVSAASVASAFASTIASASIAAAFASTIAAASIATTVFSPVFSSAAYAPTVATNTQGMHLGRLQYVVHGVHRRV